MKKYLLNCLVSLYDIVMMIRFGLIAIISIFSILFSIYSINSNLINSEIKLKFYSIACPALSILCSISPALSIFTSDISTFPLLVISVQNFQNWILLIYGIIVDNYAFQFNALIGILLSNVYLFYYFRNFKIFVLILINYLFFSFFSNFDHFSVGIISSVVNILLCLSPLASLPTIIRTRNASSIPLPMTVVMGVTNGLWTLYGVELSDPFVSAPSAVGCVLNGLTVGVVVWASRGKGAVREQSPTPDIEMVMGRRGSLAESTLTDSSNSQTNIRNSLRI